MEQKLHSLFEQYDTLLVLDTETSGLRFEMDEIIELSAVSVRLGADGPEIAAEYDELIALSPAKKLDYRITQLTGISDADLKEHGIPKKQACADFAAMLSSGKTLIVAYNAHFDMSFLYYFLQRDGDPKCLCGTGMLDALSVYRDRREYPHKLCNAIEAYGLQDTVCNSHRAIDDVKATVEVLKAMEAECPDLARYINLFGYNPKYGVQGKRIRSVTYVPQPYNSTGKLYERL